MNSSSHDVTHTSNRQGEVVLSVYVYVCVAVSVCVCVCVIPCNASGGWTRWPSRCVGGSSCLWQTDTMGTVFKEHTSIHKHTYMHTVSQPLADEEYNFSNHCYFVKVCKGSSELAKKKKS